MGSCASVGPEVDLEIAIEQRRIRRRRQRRGAVHRRLDRLAHRLVAVTFPDGHLRHLASRHLSHIQHAFYSRPRRRRAQPRPVDPGGDLRLPVGQGRSRACRSRLILPRETALKIRLPLTPITRIRLALLLGGPFLSLRRGARLALRLGLLALLLRLLGGLLVGRLLFGDPTLLVRRGLLLFALLLARRQFFRRRLGRARRLRPAVAAPALLGRRGLLLFALLLARRQFFRRRLGRSDRLGRRLDRRRRRGRGRLR